MRPADLHPLFDELPGDLAALFNPQRPWNLLGDPLQELLAALPSERIEIAASPDFRLIGDRIVIGKGTRIAPGAVIEGPAYIGRDVTIRAGAYLRGGVWLEDGSIVGANTEVKHALFLHNARAPHQNYVGDSILGANVNLGAGTILSNFRFDGAQIAVPIEDSPTPTGRRKLGAILGDGAQTGCNCVLSPGVLLGPRTVVYSGLQLRPGVYPADSIIKLRQQIEIVGISPRVEP